MSKRRIMKLGFEGRHWSDLSILEARRVGQRITPYIMYSEDEDLRKLVSATSSAAYLKKLKAFKTKKVDGRAISDLVDEEQTFFDANGGVDALIEALGHQTYKNILEDSLSDRILIAILVRNLIDLDRRSRVTSNGRLTPSLTRATKMAINEQISLNGAARRLDQIGREARFELSFTKARNTVINAAWQRYISVPHLIYASIYESTWLLPQQIELAGTAATRGLRAQILPLTLSLIVATQEFLVSLKPKGGKTTIVSGDTVWRLPANLTMGLPAIELDQHELFSMEKLKEVYRALPDE